MPEPPSSNAAHLSAPFRLDEELWQHLIPDSRRVLSTASDYRAWLAARPAADGSPAITLVFKALEIELLVRVLHPFRIDFQRSLPGEARVALLNDLKREEWSRPLGRFFSGGRPPALAETMSYLVMLNAVAADVPGNVLALWKRWLRSRFASAHHWWGRRRVAQRMAAATITYRNRYIHDLVATTSDVERALAVLWGQKANPGLLLQAFRILTHGLPRPLESSEPCRGCGRFMWAYPLRVPERHCLQCPGPGN